MWAWCGFDVTKLRGLFSISIWLSEYVWSASVHDRQESSPGSFEHIMKQTPLWEENALEKTASGVAKPSVEVQVLLLS